jgi:hypothetical protein
MKLTIRIPTQVIGPILTEALGMTEPIVATDSIECEFDIKPNEMPAYAKAVGDVADVIERWATGEPGDGTSPHTVPMDDPNSEEMFPGEEAA